MHAPNRLLIAALLLSALVVPATVPVGAQTAADCPPIMATADLQPGMTGNALSVISGETPISFPIVILGVYENALAPGRDMIIIDMDSPLPQAGGWAGMSGSPVYVGGRLVGSIAYGLAAGTTGISGVTPAEDMVDLVDGQTQPESVTLPASLQRRIAGQAGVSASAVPARLEQLPLPLAMSGLSAGRMAALREAASSMGLPYFPVQAGGGGTTQTAQSLQPGSNIAAALALGDVNAAAVGTLTAVCGDRLIAFGHPFTFEGATTLSMNTASAIAVIPDPIFGSYKLANVGPVVGSFDTDRGAGIAGTVGDLPYTVPIMSELQHDVGSTRTGKTDAVGSDRVPFATFSHLLANLDVTYDSIGEGRSQLTWTVTGTHKGKPWALYRTNRYSSEFDIAFESIFEVVGQMDTLAASEFGPVEFNSVQLEGLLFNEARDLDVVGLKVKRDGKYRNVSYLTTRAGKTLRLRILLRDQDGDIRRVDREFRIRRNAAGDGVLSVGQAAGGFDQGFGFECAFGACAEPVGGAALSFEALLKSLQNAPRNDYVAATLVVFPFFGEEPLPEEPVDAIAGEEHTVAAEEVPIDGGLITQSRRWHVSNVVRGQIDLPVLIKPAR